MVLKGKGYHRRIMEKGDWRRKQRTNYSNM